MFSIYISTQSIFYYKVHEALILRFSKLGFFSLQIITIKHKIKQNIDIIIKVIKFYMEMSVLIKCQHYINKSWLAGEMSVIPQDFMLSHRFEAYVCKI